MDDSTITFVVLGVGGRCSSGTALPVAIVAVGAALSLWATGVLELEQALAGFGDPTVIFIASLFVVSEGARRGGRDGLGRAAADGARGESRTALIVYDDAAGARC